MVVPEQYSALVYLYTYIIYMYVSHFNAAFVRYAEELCIHPQVKVFPGVLVVFKV